MNIVQNREKLRPLHHDYLKTSVKILTYKDQILYLEINTEFTLVANRPNKSEKMIENTAKHG